MKNPLKNPLNNSAEKAILVVSFGTSHSDTRKVTIDAIEEAISLAFPDYAVYRAWTSKMIIKKLKTTENILIPTVKEAMEQMAEDGVTDVIVQPTHVISGIENSRMKEDALSCSSCFRSISFGEPLVASEEGIPMTIDAITDVFSQLSERQALVLVGHGTSHPSNNIYTALNDAFTERGHTNIFIGTVESCPDFDWVLKAVKCCGADEVVLAPFLIVAGDHAKNDIAGSHPGSWYSRFVSEGFRVRTVIKGLGEYPQFRQIFIDHIRRII